MDGIPFDLIVKLVSSFGVPGIIFVVWYFSEKSHEKTLLAYREDTVKSLVDMQRKYDNNVELVKSVIAIAQDQKDVIILNTQHMQRLNDKIDNNQFCPMVRLKKQASGREE